MFISLWYNSYKSPRRKRRVSGAKAVTELRTTLLPHYALLRHGYQTPPIDLHSLAVRLLPNTVPTLLFPPTTTLLPTQALPRNTW